jgi:tRNA1Val (adenine37-N6)-methyltransferase
MPVELTFNRHFSTMQPASQTKEKAFHFKQFSLHQDRCTMKINTDGVLLGAWVKVSGAKKILDIGTGTGVIAIMLAQRNQNAQILGVEIEAESAGQAKENMQASPWKNRLLVQQSAIQDFAKFNRESFDCIVSNPPFFSGGVFSDNENRNNVRHAIKLSHGDLLQSVKKLLSPGGSFNLVLPYLEGLRFVEMAENYGLFCTSMMEVRGKKGKPVERILLQFEKEKKELSKEEIILNDENGFTAAYKKLTRDFYLNF